MKIAVMNFSGNVGKTTVARHLLLPRLADAELISVESINADASESDAIRGSDFGQLQAYLQSAAENVVVDIGASNVEALLALMRKYRGSQHDFDYYVIPTVPGSKQQQSTITTLAELARMGVGPDRVRLVFNQVDDEGREVEVRKAFPGLFSFTQAHPECGAPNPACRLTANELYQLLVGTEASVRDLAHDETDYKRLIAQTPDQAEKIRLAEQLSLRRLAQGVWPELNDCFEALGLR